MAMGIHTHRAPAYKKHLSKCITQEGIISFCNGRRCGSGGGGGHDHYSISHSIAFISTTAMEKALAGELKEDEVNGGDFKKKKTKKSHTTNSTNNCHTIYFLIFLPFHPFFFSLHLFSPPQFLTLKHKKRESNIILLLWEARSKSKIQWY